MDFAKLAKGILVALVVAAVLGACSDDRVTEAGAPILDQLGLKTTESLIHSMWVVMGKPAYNGNNEIQNYLSNFRSSLAVDGSHEVLSGPLIMTQMGLGSYFCLRGLDEDRQRPDEERLFLKGVNWNGNPETGAPEEVRREYFKRLIRRAWGQEPTKEHLAKLEKLYTDTAAGFGGNGANELRMTLRAICTAVLGSIHFALTK